MKSRNLLVSSVNVDWIKFNPSTQILTYADPLYVIWYTNAETLNASYMTYSQQTTSGDQLLVFVSSLALVSQSDMSE